MARVLAFAIVETCLLLTVKRRWTPARRAVRSRPVHVILTGTFLSDNWMDAHVRPLARSAACGQITVVADHPMRPMAGVGYVCPPRWSRRLLGRVPSRSLTYLLTAIWKRPDVCGGFHFLCNGMLALVTARMIGARSLYFSVGGRTEIAGGGTQSENRLFSRIGRDDAAREGRLLRLVKRVDLIVAMGSGGGEFLRQRAPGCRVEVVPGGIDDGNVVAATSDPVYDVVGVFRLAPTKRPDIFLRVIARVAESVPGVRAAILGDGPLREELLVLRETLGLHGRVLFAGHQTDVFPWLAKGRLLLLTSDSEGVALSVMEALTGGLPVVASDVGDLRDVVHDGTNGFLVPFGEIDAYAEAVRLLLSDAARREAFSAAARAGAAAFSVAATSRRWQTILGERRTR